MYESNCLFQTVKNRCNRKLSVVRWSFKHTIDNFAAFLLDASQISTNRKVRYLFEILLLSTNVLRNNKCRISTDYEYLEKFEKKIFRKHRMTLKSLLGLLFTHSAFWLVYFVTYLTWQLVLKYLLHYCTHRQQMFHSFILSITTTNYSKHQWPENLYRTKQDITR